MSLIGRLFLVAFALLLAVPAGAGVLGLALVLSPEAGIWLSGTAARAVDGALSDLAAGLPPEGLALLVAGLAWAAFVVLVVPPVLVALAGEILRLRGLAWYGGVCGLLTAAMPWLARGGPPPGGAGLPAAEVGVTAVLFAAGASAGLVYWLVAGRGREPAPPVTNG